MSADALRRAIRSIARDHAGSVRPMQDGLARLFERDDVPMDVKSDAVLGGLARRRFLRIGATSVAAAAVLAACGNDEEGGSGAATTTTTAKPGAAGDITILRTASSLELVAADAYDKVVKAGLITNPTVLDAAKTFMEQHEDHAALFENLTKKLGGRPFTEPNPALGQQLAPRIAGLTNEQAALALALELERAAAATYVASVGAFTDTSLNEAVMSVGGVEARHAAVLATVLGQPAIPGAFAATAGAVPAGTGV